MRRDDREVKNMEEIQEILDTCKVCRLGMADGSRIYIVPMNFGYEFEGDSLILYFHGAGEGRKLELIRKNPEVGIEMDCRHELAGRAGSLSVQLLLRECDRRRKGGDSGRTGGEIESPRGDYEASDRKRFSGIYNQSKD